MKKLLNSYDAVSILSNTSFSEMYQFTEEMIILGINQGLIDLTKNEGYINEDNENLVNIIVKIGEEKYDLEFESESKEQIAKELTTFLNEISCDETYEFLIRNISSPIFTAEYDVLITCSAKRTIEIPLYLLKGKSFEECKKFARYLERKSWGSTPEKIEYLDPDNINQNRHHCLGEEIERCQYSIKKEDTVQILKEKEL